MACACKVTQQIDYLHKKYGDNLPKSKKTNISGSVAAGIENFIVYLLMIPLIPFFVVYALYKLISGKPILIDNFFKKKENVRNKQLI